MQKFIYILLIMALSYTSCSENSGIYTSEDSDRTVSIKLISQMSSSLKVVDDDNLASEQTVKNISIFFTEPSSNTITNKYIYPGFANMIDYKLVNLPVGSATLLSKDIYVITNYDNKDVLNAVSTVDDLKGLTTPIANKNNNLLPENGICMYGSTLNFNFNDGTNSPAIVNVERTAAKMRISVQFPESAQLSTNNTYLIENAAQYTYVVKNESSALPSTGYYTYALPLPLVGNGSAYTANAYIYEATKAPTIYLYTHMNNTTESQSFQTELPRPQRNYLYDIKVQIYKGDAPSGTRSTDIDVNYGYNLKTVVTIYDQYGNEIIN